MENQLTVLLIESDSGECKKLEKYAKSSEDISIVGFTNNVYKAIDYVTGHSPDAIILELELLNGSGNGIEFLTMLKQKEDIILPYILVTTLNTSNMTHEHARQLGADFIMVKSKTDYSVQHVIDFLCSIKGVIKHMREAKFEFSQKKNIISLPRTEEVTENEVSVEFDLIGMNPKLLGRTYLIEAVLLVASGKRVFIPEIAHRHKKSDASVERAMQNAIVNLWRIGDDCTLQDHYTARISPQKGAPTLNEFIFFYANKFCLTNSSSN